MLLLEQMATLRQKRVFAKVVENGGGSVSAAMREAGYSKATAKTPQKLTESKSWQELMEEFLPDLLLGEKHKEFLLSKRIIRTTKRGDLTTKTEETDPSAVKALDMAYKLKRRYGDINIGSAVVLNINGSLANKYGVESNTAPILPAEQNMALDEHRDVSPPTTP